MKTAHHVACSCQRHRGLRPVGPNIVAQWCRHGGGCTYARPADNGVARPHVLRDVTHDGWRRAATIGGGACGQVGNAAAREVVPDLRHLVVVGVPMYVDDQPPPAWI